MASRERIIDSAAKVFGQHGYRLASMELAAQEAGLTRQALYHHFASKEALFRAVLERLYEQGLAAEIAAAKAAEEAGLELADILVAEIGARMQSLLASLKDSPHTEELFSEHLAQARDLYQSYSMRFADQIATTIGRVCRKRKLTLARGVTVRELARCVEMAIHGAKSAFPSMQPVDAFLKQLETMLRMLIAGAMAPVAKKSPRKTGVRK